MAVNPEVEGIVPVRLNTDAEQADWLAPAPVQIAAPEAQELVAPEPAQAPAKVRRSRGWVAPVAAACVGLIAAGTLGYLLYSTTNQRDDALGQLATTRATLSTTEGALTAAEQDLIARKAVAAYTSSFVADSGRIRIDYQTLEACTKFGACRTAAQSLLTNLQAFQSDRSASGVPAALANSDAMLRDALSAAIAADQEFISGMDNGNLKKVRDGWRKLSAAMLGIAKAEAALGAELK